MSPTGSELSSVEQRKAEERRLDERSRRATARRQRIETHRAQSYEEAEAWDLAYWQRRTPQERLSALVALRRDLAKIRPNIRITGE